MDNKKKNGQKVNLTPTKEEQKRLQVVDSELNARYWKSQYEVMHYSILYEEILPKYEEHLKRMKELEEKKFAEFQKAMEEMKAKGAEVEGMDEEVTDQEAPVTTSDIGS